MPFLLPELSFRSTSITGFTVVTVTLAILVLTLVFTWCSHRYFLHAIILMVLKAPYLLALCVIAQSSNVFFGLATRLGTQSSTFDVDAIRVIHSIVTASPAPESVAIVFLREFAKYHT